MVIILFTLFQALSGLALQRVGTEWIVVEVYLDVKAIITTDKLSVYRVIMNMAVHGEDDLGVVFTKCGDQDIECLLCDSLGLINPCYVKSLHALDVCVALLSESSEVDM